tara:strand:+ start:30 stop:293 length:264 start_codon:yes stop_codon:yes gene_type:complete
MTGPFKLKKGKELKDFFKTDPKKPIGEDENKDNFDDQSRELKDLRSNDKNIDLDKGGNMPVKTSGFGPSSNENLGNMMTRELEDKAE